MCEVLLENAKKKIKTDIALCGYYLSYLDGNEEKHEANIIDARENKKLLSGFEMLERAYGNGNFLYDVVWNKLFHYSLFTRGDTITFVFLKEYSMKILL